MPSREKTSVTVDPALWHKFQIKIAVDQKKSTAALDEAISAWVDGGVTANAAGPQRVVSAPEQNAYPRENMHWHDLLEIILGSETKHAIDAIQRNLEMFAFAVEVAGPKSPDEIRRILKTLQEGKAIAKRQNLKKPAKSRSNSA